VIEEPLKIQIFVVSIIAILATVVVYGVVALLVRMDDLGLSLIESSESTSSFKHHLGNVLVKTLPIIIKALGYIGTFAMLLVAGGIFVHNIHFIHDLFHAWPSMLAQFVVGIIVGIIAVALVKLVMIVVKRIKN
jgi:hypothetical protein